MLAALGAVCARHLVGPRQPVECAFGFGLPDRSEGGDRIDFGGHHAHDGCAGIEHPQAGFEPSGVCIRERW